MTFLEAAIAILQREGKPLSYKVLTEIALKDNLLTVVGRTPEATMQQRLNEALKKDDPHLMLVREKPGVYGLRFYPKKGEAPATAAPEPTEGKAADARPADGGDGRGERVGAPAAAAAREGGGEERRRRRRGGRGRRRREEGSQSSVAAGPADVGVDDDGDDEQPTSQPPAPTTGADTAATLRVDAEAAPAAASAAPAAAEPEAGGATERSPAAAAAAVPGRSRPAARRPRGDMDDDDDGGPLPARRVPPLPGSPERRSFAEAAAVVAAAHRRRAAEAATVPGTSEANGGAASEGAAPAPAATADSAAPVAVAAEPAPAQAAEPGVATGHDESDLDEFEHPSGPLIAPSYGTEELVRGEEHREPIESRERFGRGRERERFRDRKGRHGDKGRGDDRRDGRGGGGGGAGKDERREGRPQSPAAANPPAPAAPAPTSPTAPPPAARPASGVPDGRELSPVEAAIEILRNGDGRPIHVRQVVEMALKRRLLRGDVADLMRLVRGAIIVDSREREAAGLRPRVRAAGGSSYQLADRRLDPELSQQERELAERAARLTEATRLALLRRLGRLPPHAFEALMRLLAARLGLVDLELVKRGDGVAYFGGQRTGSAADGGDPSRRRRVLLGIRPGDSELSRRAVGELRAGLKARNYDEGLLLAAGRLGDEALAELGTSGGSVTVHDADELASLCVRHGVGTMRRAVPVDVLDVDLIGDLAEA